MSKILISSIGAGDKRSGNYRLSNYSMDGKIYKDKKFIADVLCEHIKIDKLFLIGTKKSIWDAVYKEFGGSDEDEFKIYEAKENNEVIKYIPVVTEQIDKKLGVSGSKCFIIEYGIDEEQLWSNFNQFLKIFDEITKDDEVYLDITHSFRSLSLMSFVMSEFYANTRDYNLNIGGVYYGMIDIMSENDNIAPIVDLKMFFELLEWSKAIKNLKKFGNGYDLMLLVNKSQQPERIINSYTDFSYALSMSDVSAIQKSIKSLNSQIFDLNYTNNTILKIVSKDIKEFIDIFKKEKISDLQLELAEWYSSNKNYAMSYLTLAEAVLSLVCEQNHKDPLNRDNREDAKNTLVKYAKQRYGDDRKKLAEKYLKINSIRVNIAHKLDQENQRSKSNPRDSVNNLPGYIQSIKNMKKYHFEMDRS
ncbi:TIGR02221 family CRISPR-associated protein [Campylobacter sp. CCUG 57310]|uniref:TIGR02221 family CRISPR-associated protein n=1 Tax=Campylobacter sp. CCUG 57310 TaxID=2517362 RepID=UPI001566AC30|nr:TIGR02221 family CRISPR-associated protein [Campylobacter sp. CCUG 57310]QKF92722.1 CRISPR/Cas system-associated DxTHG motif protein [Campylobacter sp. CCUG 57310]